MLLEWYARKKDLPSMSKERVVHGPGGQVRTFCYKDILDEICEADLGPADAPLAVKLNASPDKVFAAAAQRLNDLYLAEHGEDVPLPIFTAAEVHVEGIRQLCSSTELITEGKEMLHCVGGYIAACLKGISYIFAVSTVAGRSTFEVCENAGFYLAQHQGFHNTLAPQANCDLVAQWCMANGIRSSYHATLSQAA